MRLPLRRGINEVEEVIVCALRRVLDTYRQRYWLHATSHLPSSCRFSVPQWKQQGSSPLKHCGISTLAALTLVRVLRLAGIKKFWGEEHISGEGLPLFLPTTNKNEAVLLHSGHIGLLICPGCCVEQRRYFSPNISFLAAQSLEPVKTCPSSNSTPQIKKSSACATKLKPLKVSMLLSTIF